MGQSAELLQHVKGDSYDNVFTMYMDCSFTDQGGQGKLTAWTWLTAWTLGMNNIDSHVEPHSQSQKDAYLQGVPRLTLEGQDIVHHVSVSYLDAVARESRFLARSQAHRWKDTKTDAGNQRMSETLLLSVAGTLLPIASYGSKQKFSCFLLLFHWKSLNNIRSELQANSYAVFQFISIMEGIQIFLRKKLSVPHLV